MNRLVFILGASSVAAIALGLWLVFLAPGGAPPSPSYTEPPRSESLAAPAQRTPIPHVTFTDSAGDAQTLESRRGKVLLVNFWATWCAPCIAEMPALSTLQKRFPEGFEVLALSQDREGAPVVKKFYEGIGIENLPILLDTKGEAGRAIGGRGLPTTLLVDRQGREALRVEGGRDWDQAPYIGMIEALLAE
ncbi:MAG: TlpA family protein disulfide reductase, partial [Alphaproteobacteria bacterium]|nr:TlpA family protein disulfide reductase [Alphaproteobacteria bacterium]